MAQNGDPKCRTMMLTQQTAYLGQSFDDLVKSIDGLGADRWAVIEHDMDVSEDGSKAADHVHAALSFKNPRTLSAVARKLRVKPQYIAKWDAKGGSADNAFSYLCHRTASTSTTRARSLRRLTTRRGLRRSRSRWPPSVPAAAAR